MSSHTASGRLTTGDNEMNISRRTKVILGAAAAALVVGAAGIGAAYAADGDSDGDNDGSLGPTTVQTP